MRSICMCLALFCLLSTASASALIDHEATRAALADALFLATSHVTQMSQSVVNTAHLGLREVHRSLTAAHDLNGGIHAHSQSSGFHSMASATCVSAIVQLNATVYSGSCQSYIGIINANPLEHPAQLNDNLATLCASTCLQQLSTAAAAVAVGCQNADAAALTAQINQFVTLTNLLCTKDPNNANNFCFAEFFTSFQPINNGLSTITAAQLKAFCTPCTSIILNGLVSSGAFSAGASTNISAVSLICSTDPVTNQYCIVELQGAAQLFSTFSGTNFPQITNAQFQPLCSGCTKKFLAYLNNPLTTATLAAVCVMNGNNFCFVQDVNALGPLVSQLSGLANQGNNPGALQQACSAISSFINTVGCCANALNALSTLGGSTSGGFSFNSLYALCNINNPGACNVPSYTGTFKFVITNFAYAYYQANTAAVNAAIIADVALNLGVSSNQVSVTSVGVFTASGNQVGVQITVSVTFGSTLESTTALGLFNTGTQTGNFQLTSVAQLGPSSRIAPASPVATSSSNAAADSTAPTYTNASSQKAPVSLFALVAAAFIAIAFTAKN